VGADAKRVAIREKNAATRKVPVAEERSNPIVARSSEINEGADTARGGGFLSPGY
jgi:hypothetical protein